MTCKQSEKQHQVPYLCRLVGNIMIYHKEKMQQGGRPNESNQGCGYSLGHLSSEVMGTLSRSKLKALSGYGATN